MNNQKPNVMKFTGDLSNSAYSIVENNLDKLNKNDLVLIESSNVDLNNNKQVVTVHIVKDN